MCHTRIALVQQTAGNDFQSNLDKGLRNAELAAKQGARVICFSELAFVPFHPQKTPDRDPIALAETIPGPTTDRFTSFAKEMGVVVILNLYERAGIHTYDSSPVIDPTGKILGVTRMIHITEYDCFHEQHYYDPGDRGVPVYETPFGRIGVAICYDRHYPEVMRALALRSAEMVFIPQAGVIGEWPEGLYEAELRVAAFQNGYFTALCNRVGQEERLNFAGESFVCDPDGFVVGRAAKGSEEILIADIDRERVSGSHARRLFLPDRRPGIYEGWGIG